MEIKKNTLVLLKDPLLIPECRLYLVTKAPQNSNCLGLVDLKGEKTELTRREFVPLAQVEIKTRSVKKALASCYLEAVMNLIKACGSN